MSEGVISDGPQRDPLGWHVIAGSHLIDLLRRAAQGEDPDLLFAELWANAEHDIEGAA